MVFRFPSLATFHLALISGQVPLEISTSPATAAINADGKIWVETNAKISAAVRKNLQNLGVTLAKKMEAAETFSCASWPQILPLEREQVLSVPASQTAVIFALPSSTLLPDLAGEMLRLGNDRQSFRYLECEGTDPSVLLRVYGPPYYSLLQALDRDGKALAPRAYLERAPKIWIEIGYNHPLIETLKAPEGQMLFLDAPRQWQNVPEAPFRDIYDILEFPLPRAPVAWHDHEQQEKFAVPLCLTRGSSADQAELWVIRDKPMEQMEALVRHAGDKLLARLSFAVAENGAERAVVLRVRPSRQPPPVLVLQAQPFRGYLKMPNLFVPCGMVLHPPLRRDVIRRLLADDLEQVTWLYPNDDGTFTPESLPDRTFRPLSEWVDYVLTSERTALQSWVQSTIFDFDKFVCTEDKKGKGKPKEKTPDKKRASEKISAHETDTQVMPFKVVKKQRRADTEDEALLILPRQEPTELQKRLRALEQQFLSIEGALDAPQRQVLWPELALVYTALENHSDAAICWVNALWEENGQTGRWARTWRQASLPKAAKESIEQFLDEVLATASPSPRQVRTVAALVIAAAFEEQAPSIVMKRLGRIQTWLRQNENQLPVRAVWLVAKSLYELSGHDVLTLAQTRDRLLERLFQNGLTIEQDLPSFLRFTGGQASDRFRVFRDWLSELPRRVRHWLEKVNHPAVNFASEETVGYANLILSYGFARLGENDLCLRLLHEGKKILAHKNDIHTVLLEAFGYRIEQARNSMPAQGSLPSEQMEYLEHMEKEHRYVVNRFREYSEILEPHEKLNPFRDYHKDAGDDLNKALNHLPDERDKFKLEKNIHELLNKYGTKGKQAGLNRARILHVALETAPRIGESFAVPLLAEVPAASDEFDALLPKTQLLEKALFVAAHFDQPNYVQIFVQRFGDLLKGQRGTKDLNTLNSLADECFRGLRKLGLRENIHQLLGQLSDTLLRGRSLKEMRKEKDFSTILSSLLHVASGWYYFGMNEQAQPIMDEARRLLYKTDLERHEKRNLACGFIAALAQAPPEFALRCIDELFNRLHNVYDSFLTNRYYGLWQLDVIETVVLAIVTEDFAMGTQTRRWLDDDEFLVRRCIHEDVKEALQKGS